MIECQRSKIPPQLLSHHELLYAVCSPSALNSELLRQSIVWSPIWWNANAQQSSPSNCWAIHIILYAVCSPSALNSEVKRQSIVWIAIILILSFFGHTIKCQRSKSPPPILDSSPAPLCTQFWGLLRFIPSCLDFVRNVHVYNATLHSCTLCRSC